MSSRPHPSCPSAPLPRRMDAALPVAVVDLDAFDHNLGLLQERAPTRVTLRIATKSLRVPGLVRRALDGLHGRAAGVMTFRAAELEGLRAEGVLDAWQGYPVQSVRDADALAAHHAAGGRVMATVDDADGLQVLDEAAARAGVVLPVAVDVDCSLRPGGGVHLGVRRSPVLEPAHAVALAAAIAGHRHLRLAGLLAYEAQVAGLAPLNPRHQPWLNPVRRLVRDLSVGVVARRRKACLEALAAAGYTSLLVNGGGTGSILTTGRDPTVDEVTVGSGLYGTTLFDHYPDLPLRPALFLGLEVTRRPATGWITCQSGGFIASGPPSPDRTPLVVDPAGARPSPEEGWGEVQTPLRLPAGVTRAVGEVVWVRPAKAGEPLDRFGEVWLRQGGAWVGRLPTLRGLGLHTG